MPEARFRIAIQLTPAEYQMLQALQKKWGVSQAEALRRAIQLADKAS